MKKIQKIFLFAVGLVAIALEEISQAINEAANSLEEQQPKFIDQLSEQKYKL